MWNVFQSVSYAVRKYSSSFVQYVALCEQPCRNTNAVVQNAETSTRYRRIYFPLFHTYSHDNVSDVKETIHVTVVVITVYVCSLWGC